ncbi:MAG: arginine N-succinyltransferase [Polyangiales bacterium]|jgi:arginine N-succinyltransferase
MLRYEIRAVTRQDKGDLLELARFLDSVNLPNDPEAMEPIIAKSEDSFLGTIDDPKRREYVFVLYDRQEKRAVGTSLIVGQLGRRDAPYIYLTVGKEERYSQTLDRHFVHKVLSIGYSYEGPTEIGGLVMHPEYRKNTGKLGMQISYVRFLFIAMERACFRDRVLAELLPPLQPDGTSHLWEAVGRRFTGMDYRAADRLSRKNKEFIRGLFPDGDIYASLLSDEAQSVIGEVGAQTRGVEKMLRRIGFRYVNRVDPFDGGPHFLAETDEITLVNAVKQCAVRFGVRSARVMLGTRYPAPPYFRAAVLHGAVEGEEVIVNPQEAEDFALNEGDIVHVLPI